MEGTKRRERKTETERRKEGRGKRVGESLLKNKRERIGNQGVTAGSDVNPSSGVA